MCEQLEKVPQQDEIPPEFEDFPEEVQQAIIVYGKLGDRIIADVGYMGKDYTSLQIHMKILGLEDSDIFMETILRIDEKAIKKSNDQMKRERDKLKKK